MVFLQLLPLLIALIAEVVSHLVVSQRMRFILFGFKIVGIGVSIILVFCLTRQAEELQAEIEGIQRYSSVARLNVLGVTGRVGRGSGLKEQSSISRALEDAYIMEADTVRGLRCDRLSQFEKVIEIEPDFPFAHHAISWCAKRAGNPLWKVHADRAAEIYEHTTKLAGHHRDHDSNYANLKRLLADDEPKADSRASTVP